MVIIIEKQEKKDKIIKDVMEGENYLACSLETRSEIVILLETKKRIIGQIDVDSDQIAAFYETDRKYLREIAGITIEALSRIEAH